MKRVLVMNAGTGASNNLARSLRSADPSIAIFGCNEDPFLLTKSSADRNALVPGVRHPDFMKRLRALVVSERIDLIIPTTDIDVRMLSEHRRTFSGRVFLPRATTVALCQDKFRLSDTLRAHGIATPATRAVRKLADFRRIFAEIKPRPYLWCRARRGTGSLAALPVRTVRHAKNWVLYWQEMRGLPVSSFMISEYLPGRDFACQSLWKGGRLILIKTTERISYFQGGSNPSGVSSIGAVHKTIRDTAVAQTAASAVRAADPRASGAFSIDLKEDRTGRACVTEINVGRFLTGTTIFDLTGKHNMVGTYVKLAFGEPVAIDDPYDTTDESYYMIRDLDALPDIVSESDIADLLSSQRTPR